MFRVGLNKSAHRELQVKANHAFDYLSKPVEARQIASSPAADLETATLQV